MKRERVQKKSFDRRDQEEQLDADIAQADKDLREGKTKTLDELDDVLDEIDSVLEENAEEFVNQYIQKGGE